MSSSFAGAPRFALTASFAVALAACIGGVTPASRVSEAAQELNVAARFGRMDVSLERVAPTYRDEFAKRHAAWGNSIRVNDSEFSGMILRDRDHAEVYVAVTWQRLDEADLRTTTVTQKWTDEKGSWRLAGEERTSGDLGLLGEEVKVVRPEGARRDVQFETIRIH